MKEYKRRRPRLSQKPKATLPLNEVYCSPTESMRRWDGSLCPKNCPMKGTLGCPLKGDET